MAGWRMEAWRMSSGGGWVSCGITRSEDAFAVDVSHGDICVDRVLCGTRDEAERAVRGAKLRYADYRPKAAVRSSASAADRNVRPSA